MQVLPTSIRGKVIELGFFTGPKAILEAVTSEELIESQRTGKIGGKIGGPRRAALLSPAEKSAIARYSIQCRWNRYRAAHGLPLVPITPPPRIHRAPPPPSSTRMKRSFQYKGHSIEIRRAYDEDGHNQITIKINGVRFPYSWKVNQPATPRQHAASLIDALPRGKKIQPPPPPTVKTSTPTLRISNFSNAGGTR